jgi:hypothetical protein
MLVLGLSCISSSQDKQSMDIDGSEDEIKKLKFATIFLLAVVMRSDSRIKY